MIKTFAMKTITILFLASVIKTASFAQGVRGVIRDDKKQPIPFATIYVENLKTGTNSNEKGEYEINLQPGTYILHFRSLGFKQVSKTVVVQNNILKIDVELPTEVYQMKEVVVLKGEEDPAYPIMRKVIAWAPYHLNQVSHYESEVYLKGTMVIEKIPSLLKNRVEVSDNRNTVKINSGDVYLDESVNEITFDAPGSYKQVVKSSQSSFPNLGNKAMTPFEFIKSSLYQSELMGCISPLAPNAFAHYKFIYEGFMEEGNYVIDKIRVEPRRKSQQLFSGNIYIVDQYWCIHSADLSNEQFWGTINIKQLNSPVNDAAWLPVTYNFHFKASFMGMKGQYRYSSSVKYQNILINEQLSGPVIPEHTPPLATVLTQDRRSVAIDKDLETLLSKDKLSVRDMRKILKASKAQQKQLNPDTVKSLEINTRRNYSVEKGATLHDSTYWTQSRAIPLTPDEIKSYHRKDSLVRSQTADTSKSVSKKHKTGAILKLLFGFSTPLGDSSLWFRYFGLVNLNGLSFNTVDGWLYKQTFNINWKMDSIHNLSITPEMSYAFNRKAIMGSIDGAYRYAPMQNGVFALNLGHKSLDFNQQTGINRFVNSLSSLFFRENYMKLFDDRFIKLSNSIDLANGLRLNTSVNYNEIQSLVNHSDFSFFYRNQRNYSLNIPDNSLFLQQFPDNYKSFICSAGLTFTPKYYYRIADHRKIMLRSKYPTFNLNYTAGIKGILGSQTSYQFVTGGINQKVELGNNTSLTYYLKSGYFFNVKEISFPEFQHFNAQPLPLMLNGLEQSFQLLDFYKYSTYNRFLEGHIQYSTQLLFLKYLPVVSNTFWTENLYVNYLSTPVLKNYMEFGYGLGNIFLMGHLGVFVSFEHGTYRSVGVKVSIGLGR